MKKYLVIKNWDNGQYFTWDADRWWTRDLGQAYFFFDESLIDSIIKDFIDSNYDPFTHVSLIVLETIYKID